MKLRESAEGKEKLIRFICRKTAGYRFCKYMYIFM